MLLGAGIVFRENTVSTKEKERITAYPSSKAKNRDWTEVEKVRYSILVLCLVFIRMMKQTGRMHFLNLLQAIGADKEEEFEGDGLTQLFQKIYANGDDVSLCSALLCEPDVLSFSFFLSFRLHLFIHVMLSCHVLTGTAKKSTRGRTSSAR